MESVAMSGARDYWHMLRWFVQGFYHIIDDYFFQGRRQYCWERRLQEMLGRTYPDLEGRWAVVTGANSGIGYDLALILLKVGVSVVLACRNDERGMAAERSLQAAAGPSAGRVEYARLDVADLSSVADFAAQMEGRGVALLVCNAGSMCMPWGLTPQGFEQVFGVHVVGHALLAQRLLPELLRCARGSARIVFTSSRTIEHGRFAAELYARPRDPPRGFDRYAHYDDVKATQLCYGLALADELGAGTVAVHAVHPGCVQTSIVQNSGLVPFPRLAARVAGCLGQISSTEGASYVARACLSEDCAPANSTGQYFHCGQPAVPGPLASLASVRADAWRLTQESLKSGGWLRGDL